MIRRGYRKQVTAGKFNHEVRRNDSLLILPCSERGFMLWFDFDFNLKQEKEQAITLLKAFKSQPMRHHPSWFNLLENRDSPDKDSDNEWLKKAGYDDMKGFMAFYGLDILRVATRLLGRLRAKHQTIWEGDKSRMDECWVPNLQIQRIGLVDCSPLEVGLDAYGYRVRVQKMTKMEIEQAIIWHERLRHLGHRDLKALAKEGILHGLPDFLADMKIDDIPVCEHCTKVLGMMDR